MHFIDKKAILISKTEITKDNDTFLNPKGVELFKKIKHSIAKF